MTKTPDCNTQGQPAQSSPWPAPRAAMEQAASMTAQCREVMRDIGPGGEISFCAVLWCNQIGQYVTGQGDSEWAAVQAAHKLRATHERGLCLEADAAAPSPQLADQAGADNGLQLLAQCRDLVAALVPDFEEDLLASAIGDPSAVPLYVEAVTRSLVARAGAGSVAIAGDDWRTPTTFLKRFGDAMQLLCGGHRPGDDALLDWLDKSSDGEALQSFACLHGPAWAQGIGMIDAALTMADQPTEILAVDGPQIDHERRPGTE